MSKCDPSYGYGPIIRKLYILHYVVSGEGILHIQDKEFAVKEHDIFVIPAHTPSYYEASEKNPWNYIWIQFDGFKNQGNAESLWFVRNKSRSLPRKNMPQKTERCLRDILTNHEDEYACIGNVYQLFQHMVQAANLDKKAKKKRKTR